METKLLRQLQKRIDMRSNWLTANEEEYAKTWKPAWALLVREHTLDKRLMGELIRSARVEQHWKKAVKAVLAENDRRLAEIELQKEFIREKLGGE